MSFTDQEPFEVTSDVLNSFSRVRTGHKLCCGFCMRRFDAGETARWVYVYGASNTFVCSACDSPDVVERFQERWHTVIEPIIRRWGAE